MKKKFLGFLATVLMLTAAIFPVSVFACDNPTFFRLNPWYAHLTRDDSCGVAQSNFQGDSLIPSIWKIVLTILSDLFFIAGLLAVVYIIYSGILYITSNGDPGAAAKAKKALTGTVVGLVIVLLAHVAVNTILGLIG